MVPMSYTGVFLTLYIFELNFDDGGFASFVLLSGLVVNAGIYIYIINEYNILRHKIISNTPNAGLTVYLRAYNRKIIPIMLTVISTVLSLIPFVIIILVHLCCGSYGWNNFFFIRSIHIFAHIFASNVQGKGYKRTI